MDTHFRCVSGVAIKISQQCSHVTQCHKQLAHVQVVAPLHCSCVSKADMLTLQGTQTLHGHLSFCLGTNEAIPFAEGLTQ